MVSDAFPRASKNRSGLVTPNEPEKCRQQHAMIAEILPAGAVAEEAVGEVESAPLLPEEEAALGTVVETRRHEFTIGRNCAHRALARLGFPPAPLLRGHYRQPLWPIGVVGSITHCSGYCAAVVAHRA